MARKELNINLNRVEGDLEIGLTVEDGVVIDAKTIGSLYRGFEQILVERSPRDALVITPRVCGICGTAHLYSAVLALEHAWKLPVPPNATRIRNLCLMAEGIQNDLRQTFLFFLPDLCNPRYREHPLYEQTMAAFEPFRGQVYREALTLTRRAVEIVAVFGGQWPHSSYMLPGGVVTEPDARRVLACQSILDEVQSWYEQRVIGATLDEWLDLDNADALDAWLEDGKRSESALSLLTRVARSLDLHRLGEGTSHMLSFGAWCDPETWDGDSEAHILRSGFRDGDSGEIEPLDQSLINEHVRHSWFRPYPGGLHPWQGESVPDFQPGTDRYTWGKAPRYADKVVQTGPLAELLIAGDALITELYARDGGSAWLRQFARVRRAAVELKQARLMLRGLAENLGQPHILVPPKSAEVDGRGYGMVMAARGALGHWVEIRNGTIERYQIITPTAWNASPRDSDGQPGHWERSLIGLKISDPDDPVEIGHIIRSHDPCLVCTVHFVGSGRRMRFAP